MADVNDNNVAIQIEVDQNIQIEATKQKVNVVAIVDFCITVVFAGFIFTTIFLPIYDDYNGTNLFSNWIRIREQHWIFMSVVGVCIAVLFFMPFVLLRSMQENITRKNSDSLLTAWNILTCLAMACICIGGIFVPISDGYLNALYMIPYITYASFKLAIVCIIRFGTDVLVIDDLNVEFVLPEANHNDQSEDEENLEEQV